MRESDKAVTNEGKLTRTVELIEVVNTVVCSSVTEARVCYTQISGRAREKARITNYKYMKH